MTNNVNNNPLVSIVVITYNSARYVIEALESVKNQTYDKIELIISDDDSTDNTIEICEKWIEDNTERFKRVELIKAKKNSGIPANLNQGLYATQGVWIKFIAGDDALLENCISDNINRVAEISEEVSVLHSEVLYYRGSLNETHFSNKSEKHKEIISHPQITPKEQLEMFVRRHIPLAPTMFFRKSVLISLGGFDEKLPYEDIPIWVKLASKNIKIHFLNAVTVKYRISDSFSNLKDKDVIFKPIYVFDKIVFDKLLINYLSLCEIYCTKATFKLNDCFIKYNLNRNTPLNVALYKILNFPFYACWLLNVKIRIFKFKRRIS